MSGTGRVEALWVKRMRKGPMDAAERVELVAGAGIVDNADQRGKHRARDVRRDPPHASRRNGVVLDDGALAVGDPVSIEAAPDRLEG